MTAIDQARRFISTHVVKAVGAVLAGSAAQGRETATSDLDLAVLVTGASYRQTLRFEGCVIELFAHTPEVLPELFAAGRADRRGVMQRMYAEGVVLLDPSGQVAQFQAAAAAELSAGPSPLTAAQREALRYALTEVLDDLDDAADPDERGTLADHALCQAADLLCDHRRAWTGSGKWLPRRLRAADPQLGTALLTARRTAATDPAAFLEHAGQVLDQVGGPLREGYYRPWQAS